MIMATDERNFRSAYYEKVGCRGVEEKKSLEMLMKDKPWDKMKLKQFCLRFSVPAAYRNVVWKVLFGILPLYPHTHDFVWAQRVAQYDDLMYALKLMDLVSPSDPRADVLYSAWQLETSRQIPLTDVTFSVEKSFKLIAMTLSSLYDDEIEVYWMSKAFCGAVKSFQKDMPKLLDTFRVMLEKEDGDVYNHLLEVQAMDALPLAEWFNCCFAGVIHEAALPKVWDKVCSGAPKVLPYVAVTAVVTLRRNVLRATHVSQLVTCLTEMPEQCSELVVSKALELWQYWGTQPEPAAAM